MLTPPNIPLSGDPLRAQWGGDLIRWIKDAVMPRGDGSTTIAKGNVISASPPASPGETYNGYFKVINVTEPGATPVLTVRCIDSLIHDKKAGIVTDELAGIAILNDNEKIEVKAKEFIISAASHLVLEVKGSATANEIKLITGLDFDPKKAEDDYNTEQGNPSTRLKLTQELISRIKIADDNKSFKLITQELRTIPHLLIFGPAVSDVCDALPGVPPS